MNNKRKALVIGASGLIGYNLVFQLKESGWFIRGVGLSNDLDNIHLDTDVEYVVGNYRDESFILECLRDIDTVFFFASSTFPSSSNNSLEKELSQTASGLDFLLRSMLKMGVKNIIFPSSGGTIYGNVGSGKAFESLSPNPQIPYGFGKKICEDILMFYSLRGINATILRIGNVYGSSRNRTSKQGVIDIFIQQVLQNKSISIWGDSIGNIRDYIFIDDVVSAIAKIADIKPERYEIYNLSSGEGTTLETIINLISKILDKDIVIEYLPGNSTNSIKRIVLDIRKISQKIGWHPTFDIEEGIKETVRRKLSR